VSISDDYARISCGSIIIDRDDRQRKVIETDDLEPSIKARGVLNPIIVDRALHLIAGERRLTASLRLGLPTIPIRYVDELSREERKLIELEENVKRRELPWRDEVAAYGELHAIYDAKSPDWSQERTAQAIGVERSQISRMLRVFEELGNPKLAQCTSHSEAFNMLKRFDERRISNVMANILDGGHGLVPSAVQEEPRVTSSKGIIPANATRVTAPTLFPESIFNLDFTQWSENYKGPKFNFVHCDFPYGIDVFTSEQSGKNRQATYRDSPDDYWNLIEAFCFNRDRFLSHSAHLMFWFSMDYYRETLEAFRKMAPDLEFQLHPVYWHKTDNVGILPTRSAAPAVWWRPASSPPVAIGKSCGRSPTATAAQRTSSGIPAQSPSPCSATTWRCSWMRTLSCWTPLVEGAVPSARRKASGLRPWSGWRGKWNTTRMRNLPCASFA
jgi:ParB/RepB/Spo0J family partition protein